MSRFGNSEFQPKDLEVYSAADAENLLMERIRLDLKIYQEKRDCCRSLEVTFMIRILHCRVIVQRAFFERNTEGLCIQSVIGFYDNAE